MSRLTEVRGQVEAWIDHLNQYSDITERDLRRLRNGAYARGFAHSLLETEVRPNVLIELGAAIGMRKPYFYFNYANKRTVRINNRQESIATASDLAGMLYLLYTAYRGLFVELARRLPGFLVDRSLAG